MTLSRRDNVKIAQRFNAGSCGGMALSPGGTAEVFCRPSGTRFPSRLNPALKRWAIVGCPSGTNCCSIIRKALSQTGAVLLLTTTASFGAAPTLDHVFPVAVQAGTTNIITAIGKFDPWPPKVWTSAPGIVFTPETNSGKFSIEVATDAPIGPQLIRLFNDQGASEPRFVLVTSEPQTIEQEPNDDYTKPHVVEHLPAFVNGRLEKTGDVDSFAVELNAGQTLIASLEAYTLASPVDAVLRVVDARGVQVAFNHDDGRTLDPFLAWTAKSSGRYVVQVFGFGYPAESSVRFTGNSKCVYRLHLSRGPYLHYTLPLGVQRGTKTSLQVVGWNLPQQDKESFDGTELAPDIKLATVCLPRSDNKLSIPVAYGPEVLECASGEFATNAPPFNPPFAVTGCIGNVGNEDRYSFTATKDEKLVIEVQSASLGFPLDAWLKIEDIAGKELAKNDDSSGAADPRLDWKAPEDGTFIVAIGSVLHRGNAEHLYRLAVAKAEPSLHVALSGTSFAIAPGSTNDVKVSIKRQHGFKAKFTIAARELPGGLAVEPVDAPEKDGDITLKLIAAEDANPFNGPIQIVATETESGNEHRVASDLTSSSVNNGVPGGFSKLIIESCDKPWLTVLPVPEKKPETPK